MAYLFSALTEAQIERLAILAEEANEVSQAAMKIIRHGYASYNPDDPEAGSNREMLEAEFSELQGVFLAMKDAGDVRVPGVHRAIESWQKKLRYCHHQGDQK